MKQTSPIIPGGSVSPKAGLSWIRFSTASHQRIGLIVVGDLLKATSAIINKHAGNEFDELKVADVGS
jgi:hypothetical protein